MIEMDFNHCQIVEKSLAGKREADEQTFASLTILAERLERLKKLGKTFSGITFSSAVRSLARTEAKMAAVG